MCGRCRSSAHHLPRRHPVIQRVLGEKHAPLGRLHIGRAAPLLVLGDEVSGCQTAVLCRVCIGQQCPWVFLSVHSNAFLLLQWRYGIKVVTATSIFIIMPRNTPHNRVFRCIPSICPLASPRADGTLALHAPGLHLMPTSVLSGLLYQETVDELSAEQIAEPM